jgi:hypothetical protein
MQYQMLISELEQIRTQKLITKAGLQALRLLAAK